MSWEIRQQRSASDDALIFQTLDWYCDDFEDPDTG